MRPLQADMPCRSDTEPRLASNTLRAVSQTSQPVSMGPAVRTCHWPKRGNAGIAAPTSTRTDGGINGYSNVHRLHPHAPAADRLTAGSARPLLSIRQTGHDSRRNSVSDRRGIAPCHPTATNRAARSFCRSTIPACPQATPRLRALDYRPLSRGLWATRRSLSSSPAGIMALRLTTLSGGPGSTARRPDRA